MTMVVTTGRGVRMVARSSVLLLAAACGDSAAFKVTPSDWDESADTGHLWDLNGSLLELARISSRCDDDTNDILTARVGSHTEFPGETVTKLQAPCAGGQAVRVDIDVDGRSIVYDFSSVDAAGAFPDAKFEGFIITDIYRSSAEIRGVSIDRDSSTVDLPEEAISFREHSLSVNLAGVAFDQSSFLKLDLVLDTP